MAAPQRERALARRILPLRPWRWPVNPLDWRAGVPELVELGNGFPLSGREHDNAAGLLVRLPFLARLRPPAVGKRDRAHAPSSALSRTVSTFMFRFSHSRRGS